MKKLVCLMLVVISTSAFSRIEGLKHIQGDWGSGGGNAVVCFMELGAGQKEPVDIVRENKNIISDDMLQFIYSIEMYDLFEAKKKRGLSAKKPVILNIKKNEEIYDYFDRIANRYENKIDQMKFMIRAGKELVPDNQLIFHNAPVEHQDDLGSVVLPSQSCLIVTMAAQVNFNNHFEVHIDERLFNHPRHSKMSKATLVLHELLYALGRKHFKHKDSGSTRKIVRNYITFHPSITVGRVAKELYDLDFTGHKQYYPNAKNEKIYQSLAVNLFRNLHNFTGDIAWDLDSWLQDMVYENYESVAEFEKKVRVNFENNQWSTPSGMNRFGGTLLGSYIYIEEALKQSNNNHFWQSLKDEYSQIQNYIETYLEEKINQKIDSELESELSWNATVDPKLVENYKLQTKDVFNSVISSNWGHEDEDTIYGQTIGLIDFIKGGEDSTDSEFFFGELEMVLSSSGCSTSSDGTTTCYKPIKFETVIPKK